jgi:hypothetical protein
MKTKPLVEFLYIEVHPMDVLFFLLLSFSEEFDNKA